MNSDETPNVFVIDRECEQKGMRVTNFDKWVISCIIGIVFFILIIPFTFKLTNSLTSFVRVNTINNGLPTLSGIILHTIVFVVIVRLLMH